MNLMKMNWLLAGTISAFFSVAFGAFGAHALKERLDAYSLGVYQTGVQYQFFHALALIVVGLWIRQAPATTDVLTAGWCFLIGTVVFSGSLYLLALTGFRMLGAITPLGGVAFLAGWFFLALAARKG